jgi:uncharacterized DUF497 family protein
LPDDPDGNVQHIAEHGITMDEVEEVLDDADGLDIYSRSSGNPITFGYTSTGKYIAVVWEQVEADPLTVYPHTAYEAPEPRPR